MLKLDMALNLENVEAVCALQIVRTYIQHNNCQKNVDDDFGKESKPIVQFIRNSDVNLTKVF